MTWQKDISDIQRKIADYTEGYYRDKYMVDEVHYWYHIPGYIANDAIENRVDKVLDIGCGYGTLLYFAKEKYSAECYGIDIYDNLKGLVDELDINFKLSNIELNDFPFDETFDRIIFTEILEHLHCCPIKTLRTLHDKLNDGGKLFLSTPAASVAQGWGWGRIMDYRRHLGDFKMECLPDNIEAEHIYQYEESELLYIFDKSGFAVEKIAIHQPPHWGSHFNFQLIKV